MSRTQGHDSRPPAPPATAVRRWSDAARRSPSGAFVAFGTWAALALAALAFAARFGHPFPIRDELTLVPYLTGVRQVTPGWLLSPHGEHRLPLPRSVYLAAASIPGFKFDDFALLASGILSFAALGLLLVVGAARGRWLLTDAVMPLALLSWGQHESMLWGFNLQFVLATVLALALAAAVAGVEARLTPVRTLLAGGCLILLVGCGGSGVVLVPPVAAWLMWAGSRELASGEPHRRPWSGWLAVALAALVCALVALYFVGDPQGGREANPWAGVAGMGQRLRVAGQFLAMGLGPLAAKWWKPICAGLAGAGIAALVGLSRSAVVHPRCRLRAAGLAAQIGGALLLALAVGWSRGGLGPTAGLAQRYVMPATVFPVVLYIASLAVSGPRLGAALRWGLLFAAVVATPYAYRIGLAEARVWRVHLEEVVGAAAGGLPPAALAARYWERLIRNRPAVLAERFRELQAAGLPPFAGSAPPLDVTVEPVAALEFLASPNGPARPRPARWLALPPESWWEQPLEVPPETRPYRLDLMLARDPRDLGPDVTLRWTLETRREGRSQVLREGSVTAPESTSDGFVVLAFPALQSRESSHLLLKVGWPSAGGSGRPPPIPLFRRAAALPTGSESEGGFALRGFVYLAADPAGEALTTPPPASGVR